MSSTTVAEFANELKKSTDTLLEQLRSAGVAKSPPTDALSDAEKQKLLGYLQATQGTATPERKKITLVKKSTSEIKQADSSGKARTIQVEVRKKRTFIKRDDGSDTAVVEAPEVSAAPQPPAPPAQDDAELARREEEARRQAELIRRQEEELAAKRKEREEQEARERAAEEARAKAEREAEARAEAYSNAQAGASAAKAAEAEAAQAVAKAQ